MKFLGIILSITILNPFFLSAGNIPKNVKNLKSEENIFRDHVIRKIYTLQNSRDVAGLNGFLKDKNPAYREAAAIGCASVQASDSVTPLDNLLKSDKNAGVRLAAAYALGQVGEEQAEPLLMNAYKLEKSPDVKQAILEALGKCGTEKGGLTFLIGLDIGGQPVQEFIGKAWGIYRFSLRNMVSPKGTETMIAALTQNTPEKVRFIAAHYLGRLRNVDLTQFHTKLSAALKSEKKTGILMNIALAAGKAKHPEIIKSVISLAAPDKSAAKMDYRVRVNAVRALGSFDYDQVKSIILQLTGDRSNPVAVTASEYFTRKGKMQDAMEYFAIAKRLSNWRARSNMLSAALKYTEVPKNKKKIADWMNAAFKKTANSYEKAFLLNGLSANRSSAMFIESRTFAFVGKQPVISTYGINALVDMCREAVKNGETDSVKNYAGTFKKAVETGDTSLITIAAGALRDPDLKLNSLFSDTTFLTKALKKCQSPEQLEARMELEKTIAFFNSKPEAEKKKELKTSSNREIEWEKVATISPEQRVRVKTSKGDIVIHMLVNRSPGSVLNFLRLIEEGFYPAGKSVFHRVVPNFVIQGGCPIGDGFGGPSYTIGSELGPLVYKEGAVGMASAGKDTEGSQWFITHSATPHLDGRYTVFGQVVEGMDVVHKIEIGDTITGFEIL